MTALASDIGLYKSSIYIRWQCEKLKWTLDSFSMSQVWVNFIVGAYNLFENFFIDVRNKYASLWWSINKGAEPYLHMSLFIYEFIHNKLSWYQTRHGPSSKHSLWYQYLQTSKGVLMKNLGLILSDRIKALS